MMSFEDYPPMPSTCAFSLCNVCARLLCEGMFVVLQLVLQIGRVVV